MKKQDQRGFTIVELLVSVGILGVVAPLLATGMFQILTSTERGRAGFEAQADTRNAAAWMSQDIVMAQLVYLDYEASLSPADCDLDTFRGTFTWTDWFGDPESLPDHTVSYCLNEENQLLRFYDCGEPIVIGRSMDAADFAVTALDPLNPLAGQEVTIGISSEPSRNRFQITDSKTVRIKLRSMPASFGQEPVPCY